MFRFSGCLKQGTHHRVFRQQWAKDAAVLTKSFFRHKLQHVIMLGDLKYVKADELAPLLTEKSIEERKLNKSEQIVIFDVRGEEEFSGGHINGAINVPSTKWTDSAIVDEVIRQHVNGDDGSAAGKTVIFHCAHSKQRGPTCARLFQEEFQKRIESSGFDLSSLPEM